MEHVRSPRGNLAAFLPRDGTSDLSVIASTFGIWGKEPPDEYGLAGHTFTGTFVDIGAHVGTVAIAVLVDNPGTRAILVEPLAENCEAIRANLEANGLTDRATVLNAAIGPGKAAAVAYDYTDDRDNRFIGGLAMYEPSAQAHALVPTVALDVLMAMAGGYISAMKLDCEGCEWAAFSDPAIVYVRHVFGEWHGHDLADPSTGPDGIRAIFAATHEVTVDNAGGIGLFRAVAK